MTLLQVAIGGALGAMFRYLCVGVLAAPLGTAFVNVFGSLLMGLALVWLTETDGAHAQFSPVIMTGILGGFTTFSAFSLDTLKLIETGQGAMAAVYVFGTVALCLVCIVIGAWVARGVLT